MKIEITDRVLWKTKCQNALKAIIEYRDKEDEEYVQEWRNSKFKLRSREGKFPPREAWYYPNRDFGGVVHVAKSMLRMLNSQGTGTIFIDDEDLRAIEDWC